MNTIDDAPPPGRTPYLRMPAYDALYRSIEAARRGKLCESMCDVLAHLFVARGLGAEARIYVYADVVIVAYVSSGRWVGVMMQRPNVEGQE